MTTTDPLVEVAALAACDGSHGWGQPCVVCVALAARIAAEVKAVFADECLDHANCTHVGAHPLSIVPDTEGAS